MWLKSLPLAIFKGLTFFCRNTSPQKCLLPCPPIDPKHPPRFRNISGKWNSIDHCDLYASYDDQSTNHNFILDEGAIHGNHNHHEHFPHLIGEMKWSLSFLKNLSHLFGGIPWASNLIHIWTRADFGQIFQRTREGSSNGPFKVLGWYENPWPIIP